MVPAFCANLPKAVLFGAGSCNLSYSSCWKSKDHAPLWTCIIVVHHYNMVNKAISILWPWGKFLCVYSNLLLGFVGSWHWRAASIVGYKLRSAHQSWELHSQVSWISTQFPFRSFFRICTPWILVLLSCIIYYSVCVRAHSVVRMGGAELLC